MTPNDLERMLGADAAMRLMARRAGQVIYVPKVVTALLLDMAGSQAGADQMVADHAGDRVIIPSGRKWRMIHLIKSGMSTRDTALTMGVTERAVRQIVSQAGLQPETDRADAA